MTRRFFVGVTANLSRYEYLALAFIAFFLLRAFLTTQDFEKNIDY